MAASGLVPRNGRRAAGGALAVCAFVLGACATTSSPQSGAESSATTASATPAQPTSPIPTTGGPPVAAPTITAPTPASPVAPPPSTSGDAAAALETLPVKGRAPKTGYARSQFGDGWTDTDGNGCDTRNDILRRDLVDQRTSSRCVVSAGVLNDPYSGAVVQFLRGKTTSDDVQIDHVVSLADAWQKGAQQASRPSREAFANDPLNLLAVRGDLNLQKGDGDAATWLPPLRVYRCAFVARQVAVKAKYSLWVTSAEHDAIAGILTNCPGQPLPG